MPRTHQTDAKAIARLRLARGWNVEELSTRSNCSIKTIGNAEAGKPIYLFTAKKIAKALGVAANDILMCQTDLEEDSPHRTTRGRLLIDGRFADFDEVDQLRELLTKLLDMLNGGSGMSPDDDIDPTGAAPGSVVIDFVTTPNVMAKLIEKLDNGDLDALNILSVTALRRIIRPRVIFPPDSSPADEGPQGGNTLTSEKDPDE